MHMMITWYDGFSIFQELLKVKKAKKKNKFEYLYGLFLLEYGDWRRINGLWTEHQVDFGKARYHLNRAKRD